MDLVELMGKAAAWSAKTACMASVSTTSPVSVAVPCAFNFHGIHLPVARGQRDVRGVTAAAVSAQFGVDFDPALLRRLGIFQNEGCRALAQYKTAAVTVEWTAARRDIFAHRLGHDPQGIPGNEAAGIDHRLRSDHHDCVGVTVADVAKGFADCHRR
jgi:hypothetical protein